MSPPEHAARLDGIVESDKRAHSEALQQDAQFRQRFDEIAAETIVDPYSFVRDYLGLLITPEDKEMLYNPIIRGLYLQAFAVDGAGWVDDVLAVNKP